MGHSAGIEIENTSLGVVVVQVLVQCWLPTPLVRLGLLHVPSAQTWATIGATGGMGPQKVRSVCVSDQLTLVVLQLGTSHTSWLMRLVQWETD